MSDKRVRAAIYRSFIETGAPPEVTDLAAVTGLLAADVESALERLADLHEIVLRPGTLQIWMAHPFSGVATDYLVEAADGRSFWANCAWDALAIPGLVGDARVVTKSSFDDEPFDVLVDQGRVSPDHLVRFGVPARDFWLDIGYT